MSTTAFFKMSFINLNSSLAKKILILLVTERNIIWIVELETRNNSTESKFHDPEINSLGDNHGFNHGQLT